jgi:hypothetical protein
MSTTHLFYLKMFANDPTTSLSEEMSTAANRNEYFMKETKCVDLSSTRGISHGLLLKK